MTRSLSLVMVSLCACAAWAQQGQSRDAQYQAVQQQDVSAMLPGKWSSADGKPFAYTFAANGTYIYVGAIRTPALSTQISENGTYSVSGTSVTIRTVGGFITSTNGYKQPLDPETTVGRLSLVNTPSGPRTVLSFPDGRVFYK